MFSAIMTLNYWKWKKKSMTELKQSDCRKLSCLLKIADSQYNIKESEPMKQSEYLGLGLRCFGKKTFSTKSSDLLVSKDIEWAYSIRYLSYSVDALQIALWKKWSIQKQLQCLDIYWDISLTAK